MPFLPLNTAFAQGTVMQIVQAPKSMAIYMEDDHAGGGNRVIFMDGRPHLPRTSGLFWEIRVAAGRETRWLSKQPTFRKAFADQTQILIG